MNKDNFKVRIPRVALQDALRILRATVPTRSTSYGDTGVLFEGLNGRLRLSTTYNSGLTRIEVPEAETSNGQVLVSYKVLRDELGYRCSHDVLNLSFIREYAFPLERFAPRAEELPHAARLDGDEFRKELKQQLRITTARPDTPTQHGIRFRFEADAVVLRVVHDERMTTVQLPAEVTPEVVGREAFVSLRELRLVAPGLTGPQVMLGLSADATLFSVASGPTSLIAATSTHEPTSQPLAETVVISRLEALRALKDLDDKMRWSWQWRRLPFVLHLDANPLRMTLGIEDDPDQGRVVILDPERLRTALQTLTGRRVAVHLSSRRPLSPVTFTDADARLGDLKWRHHVVAQAPDPRPSQRRQPMPPLLPVVDGAARCALRPRTLAALHSTSIDDQTDLSGFAPCQREKRDCSRCPVMEKFLDPWELPERPEPWLVRIKPVAGPEEDELWLMHSPENGWAAMADRWSWEQQVGMHNWTAGAPFKDEHSEGFWLVRK